MSPTAARRHGKGGIKLGKVLNFDHDMELPQFGGPETKLAPHQPPGSDFLFTDQVIHESLQIASKFQITGTRLQAEKPVVNIQDLAA